MVQSSSVVLSIALVITVSLLANAEQCSKQRERFFKCMRDLHTSSDAKLLKNKNQAVAQKCGVAQSSIECWRKRDTCHNEAELASETSSAKKESMAADDNCWKSTGIRLRRDVQRDHHETPAAQQPAPDPLAPVECSPPFDAKIAECSSNALKADAEFIKATEQLRIRTKQCQDQWPQECKPTNPVLIECLGKAYEKLTNHTVDQYTKCIVKNGYHLPTDGHEH